MKRKSGLTKYYVLLAVIIIAGVLLISTLSSLALALDWYSILGYSEIIYVVPLLLIMLIISVFVMTKSVLKRGKIQVPEWLINPTPVVKEEKKEKEKEENSRFFMLSETDKRAHIIGSDLGFNNEIELKEFCEQFRNFAASKLKLYYDIKEIRRFIASLAVSHIIIMQGMSGTGKTSLAYAFGEFLSNHSVIFLCGLLKIFTKKILTHQ